MTELNLTILLAGVVAGAAPIVLATLGETISEKAGVINLALEGSILLSAMAAFAIAYETGSVLAGFAAAGLVGAAIALVIVVFSHYLNQNQVAVGFVLTLMMRDLAYFLGNSYSRLQGPQVDPLPIAGLSRLPVIGEVLFKHNYPVYLSLMLTGLCWWYIYHTRQGLQLRAVGEHPRAAYARGFNARLRQLGYAVGGGVLVGLAGATFSLSTKPGWGRPQGSEGTGWIALALVIFGGWHPIRAAIGAYLFSFLQVMGIYFQAWFPSIPAQVFQVVPFPLMIFTLVLIHLAQKETVFNRVTEKTWIRSVQAILSGPPPAALGKPFRADD